MKPRRVWFRGARLLAALALPAAAGAAAALAGGEPAAAPGAVVLAQRCVVCHGGAKPAAGLDLSRRAGALHSRPSGAALTPGDPGRSRLYRLAVVGKMPPTGPLPAAAAEAP